MASQKWQCRNCGKQVVTSSVPSPTYGSKCPSNPSGNHVWEKIG